MAHSLAGGGVSSLGGVVMNGAGVVEEVEAAADVEAAVDTLFCDCVIGFLEDVPAWLGAGISKSESGKKSEPDDAMSD
jgi:hypothetical protein